LENTKRGRNEKSSRCFDDNCWYGLLGTFVAVLADYGIPPYDLVFDLFIIISTLLFITGGVFSLKRKYWKACFASALLLFGLLIFWSLGLRPGLS